MAGGVQPAVGAVLLAVANSVLAAPVQPAVVSTASPAAGSLLQTIFALIAVLAVLALLAWCMKRFGPKSHMGSVPIKLVGALSLGGRERIMVVEVGGQWIVVGASPGRVNALATMPAQGTAPGTTPAEHQSPATSFGDWLKQTIDKRNAK